MATSYSIIPFDGVLKEKHKLSWASELPEGTVWCARSFSGGTPQGAWPYSWRNCHSAVSMDISDEIVPRPEFDGDILPT